MHFGLFAVESSVLNLVECLKNRMECLVEDITRKDNCVKCDIKQV